MTGAVPLAISATALDAAREAITVIGRINEGLAVEQEKPAEDRDYPWMDAALGARDQMNRAATAAAVVALAEAVTQFAAAFHAATQAAIAALTPTTNGDPASA